MTTPPTPAYELRRAGTWTGDAARVTLDYDARFLRRKVLTAESGERILVDLGQTTSLDHGDALVTQTGALIEVHAAPEALLEVTGPDLVRLAWHVGNRHTPCQIEAGRLLIQRDHVMADMLGRLGATLREVTEPFTPEGGAYGHGRTHGHDHSHTHSDQAHSTGHTHGGHDHDHDAHDHDHAHGAGGHHHH